MKKTNSEDFMRSMKEFSEKQVKFVLSDWLLSLSSDLFEVLLSESSRSFEIEGGNLLLDLTVTAIVLESSKETEIEFPIEEIRYFYENMKIVINLVSFARNTTDFGFKSISIFSKEVEFIKPTPLC